MCRSYLRKHDIGVLAEVEGELLVVDEVEVLANEAAIVQLLFARVHPHDGARLQRLVLSLGHDFLHTDLAHLCWGCGTLQHVNGDKPYQ